MAVPQRSWGVGLRLLRRGRGQGESSPASLWREHSLIVWWCIAAHSCNFGFCLRRFSFPHTLQQHFLSVIRRDDNIVRQNNVQPVCCYSFNQEEATSQFGGLCSRRQNLLPCVQWDISPASVNAWFKLKSQPTQLIILWPETTFPDWLIPPSIPFCVWMSAACRAASRLLAAGFHTPARQAPIPVRRIWHCQPRNFRHTTPSTNCSNWSSPTHGGSQQPPPHPDTRNRMPGIPAASRTQHLLGREVPTPPALQHPPHHAKLEPCSRQWKQHLPPHHSPQTGQTSSSSSSTVKPFWIRWERQQPREGPSGCRGRHRFQTSLLLRVG